MEKLSYPSLDADIIAQAIPGSDRGVWQLISIFVKPVTDACEKVITLQWQDDDSYQYEESVVMKKFLQDGDVLRKDFIIMKRVDIPIYLTFRFIDKGGFETCGFWVYQKCLDD